MAGHATGDEELLFGREVGDAFGRCSSVTPGPSGEFVNEIVACEDELLRGDLASGAEGGGVGYWSPAVTERGKSGTNSIHVQGFRVLRSGSSDVWGVGLCRMKQ